MRFVRVVISLVLLIALVTTAIDVLDQRISLDDAAALVLYSIAGFGICMICADYFESRRRK